MKIIIIEVPGRTWMVGISINRFAVLIYEKPALIASYRVAITVKAEMVSD